MSFMLEAGQLASDVEVVGLSEFPLGVVGVVGTVLTVGASGVAAFSELPPPQAARMQVSNKIEGTRE
jgi:hypothetical protein